MKPIYTISLLMMAFYFQGCGESMDAMDEQLRYTIESGDNGRIKKRIEMRAGNQPLEIERIKYKKTFKDIFTHEAVVTFKKAKNRRSGGKLPSMGNLPTTGKSLRIKTKFKYLKSEDRWYFDSFV